MDVPLRRDREEELNMGEDKPKFRGRPPGSKNKSTLERERKEREKLLQDSKQEIVQEVIKMVKEEMKSERGVKDRKIVLKGHAGTFRTVARKGEYALLKSEQYGDRAYMVMLKGSRIVAKDIAGMGDARVAKVFGQPHGSGRIGKAGSIADVAGASTGLNEAYDILIDVADFCESNKYYGALNTIRDAQARIDEADDTLKEEASSEYVNKSKGIGKGIRKTETPSEIFGKLEEARKNLMEVCAWCEASGQQELSMESLAISNQIVELKEKIFDLSAVDFKRAGKGDVKKFGYQDSLSDAEGMALQSMRTWARDLRNNSGAFEDVDRILYRYIEDARKLGEASQHFDDVELAGYCENAIRVAVELQKDVKRRCDQAYDEMYDTCDKIMTTVSDFINGIPDWNVPHPLNYKDVPVDADYNINDYALKSKKGRTRKDDKGGAITSGPDEPIPSADPEVEAGNDQSKGGANDMDALEPESESSDGDKGGADDMEALEPEAGPAVGRKAPIMSELPIDDDDIEKMIETKKQGKDVPGALMQPYANNYRTVQMGEGKIDPMSKPTGRVVKP